MDRFLCVIAAAFLIASVQPASAKLRKIAELDSPSKVLNVALLIDHDGRLFYRVRRFGAPVLESSQLGLRFDNAKALDRNIEFVDAAFNSHDDTWEQPWGESKFVRNHYQALRANFIQTRPKPAAELQFSVEIRLYDDGLGFRYDFPKQVGTPMLSIDSELTEFNIKPKAQAWWIPAGEWNRYEYLYNRTELSQLGQAHTPATFRTADGLHLAIHEAALVDYASMWLRRTGGQRLRAQLAPGGNGASVSRKLPFHTPWRTLQVAESAAKLYESSKLILNLNEPNKLGDVSWVKPAKYMGVWWSLHLDTETWGTGKKHGASTEKTKAVMDFAAEHGFRGVLVEGWNKGWDGDWFANGWDFSFTQATPDFDIEALSQYGLAKGVHLVGHHETACAVSHYERQMEDAFALYQRLGIDQVKTGYVCDAGQIERQDLTGEQVVREWHDGQWMSGHHLRVLEAAARHKISINAHEPIKDTGLRRTYPNWLAREGARGMEYNAWGNPPNPPEHEANLFFTRMLSGPMDFTPGVLSLKGRAGQAILSTMAKQLALYVVLYSPIQMAADLPENYARYPKAFQFIKDVPVDWQQTQVLAGEIGDFVVLARKDRASENWYLGAASDASGRLINVPLNFLEPNKSYLAQIYRDADDAHYLDNPQAIAIEQRTLQATDTLAIRLAPGGGMAVRFLAQ